MERADCKWCGGYADTSTVCPRSIDCPEPGCSGRSGGPCYRPSGHRASELHAARVALAESMDAGASDVELDGIPGQLDMLGGEES